MTLAIRTTHFRRERASNQRIADSHGLYGGNNTGLSFLH